ncbi:DE-cadherin [Uranotaenia lowii]|uniref:DE-cadherin n=1 Tax=Uranotaenia lowii TaxID=190385 RepID=UPI0024787F3D|nr:DE-cadherin [Uranotaenia lowii]XP_055601987.1 DE-cadherin [Uranotaenia lowii]XP_055601988.1 DE-cadherin [Uranotaenia lowii]XP_055601989.1 DE-cadherin [Uranotaenia lowii]XP_055601990.1 DE-cadherin [Uranotaenia lowii]XP_055601991.1 DE-cadherin [Uranotaenia lowii]XP_055601993.1 DE-cadherin [Uranotaenia lowii]XP_055601994.1 DE-cadherin [Uranotaenia lowii]XP_055601995.1 DE-cadherin [Uranotaenia lowii]XP_055601996.1 DE-cadherin [Uranotaenia lowii]XP_055601997.1 DE-cadherin [Uranotaenia lowii
MNKIVIAVVVYLAISVFTTQSDSNFFRKNVESNGSSRLSRTDDVSRFGFREVFSLDRVDSRRSRRSLYDETYETDNGLNEFGLLPLGTSRPVKAVDNRKPVFVNCEGYAPSVKEERDPGEYVIQVNATDPDEHQKISYSFVTAPGERSKFRIDKTTGQITTTHRFDRDEPIREKEVYITVRATDDGLPNLDDVCTFKVTIEDINDNPPVFDKTRYDEPITKDAKIGTRVASISATDLDDGDNSIIKYEILQKHNDHTYFRINPNNGIVTLAKSIDKSPGQYYQIYVRAYNTVPEQDAEVEVKIPVIESNKLPPYFTEVQQTPISLDENFSNYSAALATMRAKSNIAGKPELIYELITGRTEQTNGRNTFLLEQREDTAIILLGKALDYETITEYTLTVSVKNTHDLIAQTVVKIKVLDVNDNIPYFTEVTSGWIPENEPAGTPVMQVRAFDMDGTSANNIVSFRLADNEEYFAIDYNTGNITALTMFDREATDTYHLKIIAEDNSPSALYNNGKPNSISQTFIIKISDKNDHPPKFTKDYYVSENVAEDANKNTVVIVVTAQDVDTASQITYSIVSGNIGNAFKIDETTGAISVDNELDYENITEYTLQVRAFDGTYDDNATVSIKVEDVNDNLPKFAKNDYNLEIEEEKIMEGCIATIEAWDPDIKDRSAPQHIKFAIVKVEQRPLLEIDDAGCLRQKAPLDRDQPNGHKAWQVIISATDEDGSGRQSTTTVNIILIDTNDNPPFLTNSMPVVWYENQEPGRITQLTADDYDEPQNGPPFKFEISDGASNDIKNKFRIDADVLYAQHNFDREQQKEYRIPILITDSGSPRPLSKVSELHLVIGDVNDNEMSDGESKIFVYNYKGESPNAEIGRVYVEDLDDWDLPDKTFRWKDEYSGHDNFMLNEDTGMITMLQGTRGGEYELFFVVTEQSSYFARHSVSAKVVVTVKEIPEEAVDKSGSIRFYGITAEEFVTRSPSLSLTPKDRLQASIADLFNISKDNVDVFTVLQRDNNASLLDVRFSAHGSPYYEPERLNGLIGYHQRTLEEELGLRMLMVSIDECIEEKMRCELSCKNVLHKSSVPIAVYTNTSSFVGVNAFVQAECVCDAPPIMTECLNGGTPYNDKCECLEGYEGPHCEEIAIGFYGHGYAMYPPVSPCNMTRISLELTPHREDGLVMYIGPMSFNPLLPIQDFLALELVKGLPVLLLDYGTGTIRIEHKHRYPQGRPFTVEIVLQPQTVEMIVDNCKLSTCMSLDAPKGPNESLNVNSPLQLGGAAVNLESLGSMFNWTYVPQSKGFSGCLRNLTINDKTYNLGSPSLAKNHDPGCHRSVAVAVSFGIDSNFLIAIIVCIAVLLILLLAVVVHKKHQDGWHEKDMDDIRETIINYEEEGGGERDAEYDLTVLRAPPYTDKPYGIDPRQNEAVPDIGAFLTDKKDACDKDADAYPIDDVRHYAYEGDGNSSGSLSSLASCTDEGDLKFNYLSNFGPRFRKLADMYGEEPSDTDSNVDDDEGWRI